MPTAYLTDAAAVPGLQALFHSGRWLALHVSDPSPLGLLSTEVAGNGYTRQKIGFVAPADQGVANSSNLTFTAMPAGVVAWLAVWDAPGGGNMIVAYQLAHPITVLEDGQLLVAPGDIAFAVVGVTALVLPDDPAPVPVPPAPAPDPLPVPAEPTPPPPSTDPTPPSDPPPSSPPSGPGVVEFQDFTQQNAGLYLGDTSLVGAGPTASTYRMTPNTSTKAAQIPAQSTGQVVPFRLLRFGGLSSADVPTVEVAGFTLEGTDQGHIYSGLTVGYSTNANVHDLVITGIPGNGSSPPGETDSLELWHADGATVHNVTIDGRNAAGAGVAATLFGINSSHGVAVTDCTGHHSTYGMGITIRDSYDITVTDMDVSHCRHPINIENPHAGTMRFTRPVMRAQTDTGPHVTCNGNIASTQLIIEDPVVDLWPIRIGVSSQLYLGRPQLQQVSDVQVLVNGADVTHNPAFVRIGDV